jgi:cytochrome c-type biogenesis protein
MEYLQSLLDSTNLPILSAVILGLMTAISPCPLATNITAVSYISKDIVDKKRVFINGLWYTLGRTISYSGLGVILFFGANKFSVARIFQINGEKILGPLLVIVGILMLDFIRIRLFSFGKLTEKISLKTKTGKGWGALLLGILFALAFCPYSGVLYFGMLIPMTLSSPSGLLLPVIFAVATGLPVIIIAYLIAYSISGIGKFYDKLKSFEKWMRLIVAGIFIVVGLYYINLFYLNNLLKL